MLLSVGFVLALVKGGSDSDRIRSCKRWPCFGMAQLEWPVLHLKRRRIARKAETHPPVPVCSVHV